MNEHWNEIQFLSWNEFSRMAPSILKLEVTRMSALVHQAGGNIEFRNALVRSRFALQRFIDCIEQHGIEQHGIEQHGIVTGAEQCGNNPSGRDHSDRDDFAERCSKHLTEALMSLPPVHRDTDESMAHTLDYIADRLNDVYRRIPLIY